MISWEIVLILFFAAFIAGWVDTIAGGGGLITIPVLMATGMPPQAALATNKLQGSMGTLIASFYFIKNKSVSLVDMKLMILLTLVGSVLGSWFLLQFDAEILVFLMPILLIVMGVYVLLSPNVNDNEKKQRVSVLFFSLVACVFLGFYDGFFGPGTGSLMALGFMSLLGYGMTKATAHSKILNFVSNLSSLIYFTFYGEIYLEYGLIMILGQFFGAKMAVKMVLNKGVNLIKPVVVMVCFIMSVSLIVRQLDLP